MCNERSNELDQFEVELRKLVPVQPELNHAELMFRAGQASATQTPSRFWPTLSGILAISTCLLAMLQLNREIDQTVDVVEQQTDPIR